ncbi:MAG TPA: hypothetical protein VGI73_14225 [Solirubrobacterales bacterium]|jgi:hypothetical protein
MSPPKYVDLIALALALPVFLLAGFSMLGYAVGAAVWLLQRAVQSFAARRAKEELAHGERQRAMGIVAGTGLGRVWLMAAVVLVIGLAVERQAGLAAAVLVVVLFTISMVAQGYRQLFGEDAAGRRASGGVA